MEDLVNNLENISPNIVLQASDLHNSRKSTPHKPLARKFSDITPDNAVDEDNACEAAVTTGKRDEAAEALEANAMEVVPLQAEEQQPIAAQEQQLQAQELTALNTTTASTIPAEVQPAVQEQATTTAAVNDAAPAPTPSKRQRIITLADQLQDKDWKTRRDAFDKLATMLIVSADDTSLTQYENTIERIVHSEKHPNALEAGLSAVYNYLNFLRKHSSTMKNVNALLAPLIDKLNGKSNKKATDILLLLVQLDAPDTILVRKHGYIVKYFVCCINTACCFG